MNIELTGDNVDITPAMKTFTEDKLQKLTTHVEKVSNVRVIFKLDKHEHIVEGTAHVPGKSLHAKAKSENMYSAIDALVDKLMTQLDKYKGKMEERR